MPKRTLITTAMVAGLVPFPTDADFAAEREMEGRPAKPEPEPDPLAERVTPRPPREYLALGLQGVENRETQSLGWTRPDTEAPEAEPVVEFTPEPERAAPKRRGRKPGPKPRKTGRRQVRAHGETVAPGVDGMAAPVAEPEPTTEEPSGYVPLESEAERA